MVDSRYILKGELTGFPNRLDVAYERKRRVKVTPRLFTQACAGMELPLIGRGKTKPGCGRRARVQVLTCRI